MFTHKYFYEGFVGMIIDPQTLKVELDLGFEFHKRLVVRLNRIKVTGNRVEAIKFLTDELLGCNAYFQIFKKSGLNGFDKYFTEIYVPDEYSPVVKTLKDINQTLNNPYGMPGLTSINEVLVRQGLAEFI